MHPQVSCQNLFSHTVRLGLEEDLVQNAVRCLHELRSGGMPQRGVCGAHASVVDAALGGFLCGARRMCAEQATLMTERCSTVSWEESIFIVSSASDSTPFSNASCRYLRGVRHRSFSPADEMAHFINSAFTSVLMSPCIQNKMGDPAWGDAPLHAVRLG